MQAACIYLTVKASASSRASSARLRVDVRVPIHACARTIDAVDREGAERMPQVVEGELSQTDSLAGFEVAAAER